MRASTFCYFGGLLVAVVGLVMGIADSIAWNLKVMTEDARKARKAGSR